MTSAIKDQAVCLRCQNYSESSQIVTLFGKVSGKIRALAKGSRRGRSQFGVGMDLLNAGVVVFYPPRNDNALATLGEFDLWESFPRLRQNLLSLHGAQYAAEMLADFTEDFDPHEDLYDAFYLTLEHLQRHWRPEAILVTFELALLREVGLAPSWKSCRGCGRELSQEQRLYFSSGNGGLLCRECEGSILEKRSVDQGVLRILQNPATIQTAPRQAVINTHELLSYHQRELLGKQSKMTVFFNQLLRQQRQEN